MEEIEQPSFGTSLVAGIVGMLKGAFVLGLVGALAGATGGAALVGVELMAGEVLTAMIGGATLLGGIGAALGGTLGAVTGILQSRETGAPDGQDVVNVANMAYAQGMQAAKSPSISEPSKEAVLEAAASTKFQDQLAAEATQTASLGRV